MSAQGILLVGSCGAVAAVGLAYITDATLPKDSQSTIIQLLHFSHEAPMSAAVHGGMIAAVGFLLADMVKGPALGIQV